MDPRPRGDKKYLPEWKAKEGKAESEGRRRIKGKGRQEDTHASKVLAVPVEGL